MECWYVMENVSPVFMGYRATIPRAAFSNSSTVVARKRKAPPAAISSRRGSRRAIFTPDQGFFIPFSAKYFKAPGWNGMGDPPLSWSSSAMCMASLCTATSSGLFSKIVFVIW